MRGRVHVILNPNARLNRSVSQDRLDRMKKLVGNLGTVHSTRDLGELRRTLLTIAPSGGDYLVCDGGDGSLHWAMNTLIEVQGSYDNLPIFVPARGGTIDFIATKAGIHTNPRRVLHDLVNFLRLGLHPQIKELDTLAIQGIAVDTSGVRHFSRVGFALAAGGVGARFFDKYFEERVRGRIAIAKILGRAVGSHLFTHAGLPLSENFRHYGRELFRPTRARVIIDGHELPVTEHGALHAGSIDVNFRGLLRVFPLAKTSGVLHFQAGPIMPGALIRNLPSLHRGSPIRAPGFIELAGKEMKIMPLDGEVLNPVIDGERFEHLRELRIRRGPKLRVPLLQGHWQ